MRSCSVISQINALICISGLWRSISLLLHVTIFCQHQPHRSPKPHPFNSNNFIHDISCLLTSCPYSIKATESTWKCVPDLVKKNVCVKILLYANIQMRKAALVMLHSHGIRQMADEQHSLDGPWKTNKRSDWTAQRQNNTHVTTMLLWQCRIVDNKLNKI